MEESMADSTLKEDLSQYLAPTENIDSDHPKIMQKAAGLTKGGVSDVDKARALYEFVRDSYTKESVESYIASDVLDRGGLSCYQRSILLAALCRSAGIPARLHLQRVSIKDWRAQDGRLRDITFAHGLTGIYLHGAWNIYEATGHSYKWLQWSGDEQEAAKMVVAFDPDRDCLFDLRKNPRVTGELLAAQFADRTEEMVKIIEQMNHF
jgi:transglutaminase-like putative cysteine protease